MRNARPAMPIVMAVLVQGLLTSTPGEAMPLSVTRSAAAGIDQIEAVACYGFGWRGWGVYPGWFRPACNGAFAAPPYPAPSPTYAVPVYPTANRCWVPPAPDGRPGYWAAC